MSALRQPKAVVEQWINDAVHKLDEIFSCADDPHRILDEYRVWFDDVMATAALMFADEATVTSLRSSLGHGPIYMSHASNTTVHEGATSAIARARRSMEALRDRLGLFDSHAGGFVPAAGSGSAGADVFVVHGRDAIAEAAVVDAVATISGKRPIVLHEQPGRSRTIIEKLELCTNDIVGYAVIIATGDDIGGLKTSDESQELHPRARQNVVFEVGYFIGLLGRAQVVILLEEDVELMGDIVGVNYISLSGEWFPELEREMRAAGFAVPS